MQELLEWVRATLPMDLDTPRLIERKIESLLEKEKEVMCEFADDYQRNCFQKSADDYFKETFNTKEK
ncbi:MAG: hypothetical protein GY799_11280 [Desulfobulbaceae bacterium]|nr:hypothetical protein [Desulfobulbaceae bacterium]